MHEPESPHARETASRRPSVAVGRPHRHAARRGNAQCPVLVCIVRLRVNICLEYLENVTPERVSAHIV